MKQASNCSKQTWVSPRHWSLGGKRSHCFSCTPFPSPAHPCSEHTCSAANLQLHALASRSCLSGDERGLRKFFVNHCINSVVVNLTVAAFTEQIRTVWPRRIFSQWGNWFEKNWLTFFPLYLKVMHGAGHSLKDELSLYLAGSVTCRLSGCNTAWRAKGCAKCVHLLVRLELNYALLLQLLFYFLS